MTDFQSAASAQGRRFAEQCDWLLGYHKFKLAGPLRVVAVGVEIDQVATTPEGRTIWFEYKGSIQGPRPGLRRTDTLKKAIANGALLSAIAEHPPYVVLASHIPSSGSGLQMLEAAMKLGYFHDVICVNEPIDVARLAGL